MLFSTEMKQRVQAYLENPASSLPRVHGNGFIQVDLDPIRRLHVWHPDLPRQVVDTQIHDHRFSFVSTVVVGRLGHFTYQVEADPQGPYHLYVPEAREGEDTKLERRSDECFRADNLEVQWIPAGEAYYFWAEQFHETKVNALAVTLLEKISIYNVQPRVLCPVGQEPDNAFNRNNWAANPVVQEILEEAVEQLHDTELCGWRREYNEWREGHAAS